jgi:DNA-binding transcriptional regulator YiaG
MDGLKTMTEGYHYTKSGLDYVYLMNGYTVHDTPYGRGVSIQHTEQLHDAIAKEIIRRPNRMRGQEVRFLRGRMHLSQEGLARIMRTSRPAIARYEGNPLKEIPGSADVALRLFYAARMTSDPIAKEIADLLMEIDELQHGSAPVAFHETEFGWLRTAA